MHHMWCHQALIALFFFLRSGSGNAAWKRGQTHVTSAFFTQQLVQLDDTWPHIKRIT